MKADKALTDLKERVERLEQRITDLGAYVQAAVKEMRAARQRILDNPSRARV